MKPTKLVSQSEPEGTEEPEQEVKDTLQRLCELFYWQRHKKYASLFLQSCDWLDFRTSMLGQLTSVQMSSSRAIDGVRRVLGREEPPLFLIGWSSSSVPLDSSAGLKQVVVSKSLNGFLPVNKITETLALFNPSASSATASMNNGLLDRPASVNQILNNTTFSSGSSVKQQSSILSSHLHNQNIHGNLQQQQNGGNNGGGGIQKYSITHDMAIYAHTLKLSRLPLSTITAAAQKSLSTHSYNALKNERYFVAVMEEVEKLRAQQGWSLMQPRKFTSGPPSTGLNISSSSTPAATTAVNAVGGGGVLKRRKVHWDHLIEGVEALALDFVEERRWRVSMALYFAMQCQRAYQLKQQNSHNSTLNSAVSKVGEREMFAITSSSEGTGSEMMQHQHTVYQILPPSSIFSPTSDALSALLASETSSASSLTTKQNNNNSDLKSNIGPLVHCESVDRLPICPTKACFMDVSATEMSMYKDIAKILNDERLYFHTMPAVFEFDLNGSGSGSSSLGGAGAGGQGSHALVPSHPPNLQVRAPVIWTPEEDDILMKCTPLTNQNWVLLSEMLSKDSRKRKLDWDCYSRYQVLAGKLAGSSSVSQTSTMGMGLVGMLAFGKLSSRRDERRRAAKHSHFFDGVAKLVKKRDQVSSSSSSSNKKKKDAEDTKKQSSTSTGDASPNEQAERKVVNLNCHSSHMAILQRAGVEPNKFRSVLEHSDRRYKLQKMIEQQRPNPKALPSLPIPKPANVPRASSPGPTSPTGPRPPIAPARPQMTMTQQQVQQFLQRQNMLRQFPNMPLQQPGMMNLMPMQRLMYRPPQIGRQPGQPLPQTGAQPAPSSGQQQQQQQQQVMPRPSVTPEVVAAIEEAKRAQALLVQQQIAAAAQSQQESQTPPPPQEPTSSAEASPSSNAVADKKAKQQSINTRDNSSNNNNKTSPSKRKDRKSSAATSNASSKIEDDDEEAQSPRSIPTRSTPRRRRGAADS